MFNFNSYKNKYNGKVAYVCGSGKSLDKFEAIEEGVYIGANMSFTHPNLKFKMDYIFVEGVWTDKMSKQVTSETKIFYDDKPNFTGKSIEKFHTNNIYSYRDSGIIKELSKLKENYDFAGSTIFYCMLFAFHCGFSKIYIVGCDCDSEYFGIRPDNRIIDLGVLIPAWNTLKSFRDNKYNDVDIQVVNPINLTLFPSVNVNKTIYISKDDPVQIVAEIGQNHNGSVETAKKLIDACFDAGINFVKFQKRDIDTEFTKESYNKPYTSENSFAAIYGKHREFLELSHKEHAILKSYANNMGIVYFCTPCDVPSLKIMENIGCPFYKIASRDITNIPLLEAIGKLNKQVIISTGLATYEDIDIALKTLNLPVEKVIILQCTSQYPCDISNTNLNVLETFRKRYNNIIGFSDHTPGILAPIIAATKGAKVIEKHITLDKTMKGSDQKGSAEPHELVEIVNSVNSIPTYLGVYDKSFLECCLPAKNKLMKSLTTKENIKKGADITKDMLCLKCPGTGIHWKKINTIINKKAKQDIPEDTIISLDMLF
jgi:sialic acid synthase SpsE